MKRELVNKLEEIPVNTRLKIASLWIVVLILYIYNDIFALFTPGALEDIIAGNMGPFPVTQFGLFSVALLMAIPTVMIFLTLVLKPKANRLINIILSVLYIGVMISSLIGEWYFYQFMGVLEIGANIAIIWYALKWPRS